MFKTVALRFARGLASAAIGGALIFAVDFVGVVPVEFEGTQLAFIWPVVSSGVLALNKFWRDKGNTILGL